MTLAPIALFVYNRPEHVRATVEALQRNELAAQSELHVFSDGPKSAEDARPVTAVRDYLNHISGFKSVKIIAQPINCGLAQSIIAGVTSLSEQSGRVIVVEDDLITSPYFLRYMNEALALYENHPEVISIHGYVYPVKARLPDSFFIRGADCWGWATWKRGWALFNPDGRSLLEELGARKLTREFDFNDTFGYTEMLRKQIAGAADSWAIRWYASAFLQNKLTLYPGRSLIHNVGNDDSGTHCGTTRIYDVEVSQEPVKLQKLALHEDLQARVTLEQYFRSLRPSRAEPFWNRLTKFGKALIARTG